MEAAVEVLGYVLRRVEKLREMKREAMSKHKILRYSLFK